MSGILEAVTAGVVALVTSVSTVPQGTLKTHYECTKEMYEMHLGKESLDRIRDLPPGEYVKAYGDRLRNYLKEVQVVCPVKS